MLNSNVYQTCIVTTTYQAKALKKKVMEERVGQAVTAGKAEAEKVQQAGGSQVLRKSCTFMFLREIDSHRIKPTL